MSCLVTLFGTQPMLVRCFDKVGAMFDGVEIVAWCSSNFANDVVAVFCGFDCLAETPLPFLHNLDGEKPTAQLTFRRRSSP